MEEAVEVTDVKVEPNECELTKELTVTIGFDIKSAIPEAFWILRFVFDFSMKKQVVEMARTEPKTYGIGKHIEKFHVDHLDISKVKETTILNMGLLSASFFSGKDESHPLLDVNMCTEISKKDGSEEYIRTILNPLE
ncbi:uncharacterized protein MONOS_17374 [Monocercomonoides exilis]|uniref:uncharacterized protein n=1 Tax=Monocercomonoides exilis TaxID=2049356 RepID=UPI003559CF8C|nr:hypothetical protein MONOS_17374 [Monocercomonoides exilis]